LIAKYASLHGNAQAFHWW